MERWEAQWEPLRAAQRAAGDGGGDDDDDDGDGEDGDDQGAPGLGTNGQQPAALLPAPLRGLAWSASQRSVRTSKFGPSEKKVNILFEPRKHFFISKKGGGAEGAAPFFDL